MSGEESTPRFTGAVIGQSNINSNATGDNMTAGLRRRIAEVLNMSYVDNEKDKKNDAGKISTATVDLDERHRLLLIAVQKAGVGSAYHVRRTGEHKVEVSLAGQDDDHVDDFTAAFIKTKRTQFLEGDLSLSSSMTAEEFESISKKFLVKKRNSRISRF